ncbi:MAG: prolyl oligopeptidase family serine peptidase [Halobacteriales archaeon]|nr:prolyl oligopeptidase family serine peptidase [Halobacteriales archaeon]
MPENPLSIEDVLAIEYPTAPEWAADGERLATAMYTDDGQVLQIVSIDTDASVTDTWRYTPSEGYVTGFEWGPRARPTELVVTTDAGAVLLVDAAAETADRLASAPTTDASVTWGPDGDRIAFYRDGFPRVRDLTAGEEHGFDVPEQGAYLDDERMLEFGPDGDRLAFRFVEDRIKQLGVIDIETGELTWRTHGQLSAASPGWLEDGRLSYVRTGDRGRVRELVVTDPETSDETVLIREEDRDRGAVSRGAPAIGPDSHRLGVALSLDGWEHVYLLDPDADETASQLTSGEFEDKGDASATPQWIDTDRLVFASNRREPGQRHLFSVAVADGSVDPLVDTRGTNVHPRPDPDGDRLAYIHADPWTSPEVRVRRLDADPSTAGQRVTESGVDEWAVDPIEPEHVTFESADGTEIHGYVFDPRETDAVADDATELPGVVWVHGGPMRQMRDGWHPGRSYSLPYAFHQYLAREGYVGMFVNYRGGIGYGREFRQALADSRGDKEIEDIVASADYLRSQDWVDSDAIATWGLSYGGYTTLQVLGTQPEAFDLGVNLAGLADLDAYRQWAESTKYSPVESFQTVQLGGYPWEAPEAWAEASPKTHMENYQAPLYNFHGTADRYVNFEQLDIVIDTLLDLDKEFEAEYYPDENHVFSRRATWQRTLEKIETAFEAHLR